MGMHPAKVRFIAVACLLAGLPAGCETPTAIRAQAPQVVGSDLQAVRTHALAFGAILDSQNGDPHSRLVPEMGPAEHESDERRIRGMLADSWDVHDRGELLETLDNLQSGENGHRATFWTLRHMLLEAKMENYFKVITEASAGDDASARKFIVATHLAPLRNQTLPITAWDFGRYINLCRWGVDAGWITEQEAWSRILPAARLLQASYSSWDEFAADYLLGRNFWNPGTGKDNNTIRYRITLLKLPPKGLWSTIPWGQSLGSGDILRDTLAEKVLHDYKDPDPNSISFDYDPDRNPVLIMVRTSVDPK
jgi:hypothetical protein